MELKPLIVSCPFGNYLSLGGHATRTRGTFTLVPRPPGTPENPAPTGRARQILKTVRYNPRTGAWRNSIGLRNPGVDSLYMTAGEVMGEDATGMAYANDIISIKGFTLDEWKLLLRQTLVFGVKDFIAPMAVEINLSCPNVEDTVDPIDVMTTVIATCKEIKFPLNRVIVKLSPVHYQDIVDYAYDEGVDTFHMFNTIPSEKGGISGKPLRPLVLEGIKWARENCEDIKIIAGGGVTSMKNALEYIEAGAHHVAVGSCLFFPWNWYRMRRIAKRLEELSALTPDEKEQIDKDAAVIVKAMGEMSRDLSVDPKPEPPKPKKSLKDVVVEVVKKVGVRLRIKKAGVVSVTPATSEEPANVNVKVTAEVDEPLEHIKIDVKLVDPEPAAPVEEAPPASAEEPPAPTTTDGSKPIPNDAEVAEPTPAASTVRSVRIVPEATPPAEV